jgi:hypothetical protein
VSTSGDAFDLDLAASSLGAEGADVQLMMRLLTMKLGEALKDRLRIERAGGLFRKSETIRRVEIQVGNTELVASLAGTSPEFSIGRVSGGIRIRTENTDAAGWARALLEALQAEAAHSVATREALEAIVIGGP